MSAVIGTTRSAEGCSKVSQPRSERLGLRGIAPLQALHTLTDLAADENAEVELVAADRGEPGRDAGVGPATLSAPGRRRWWEVTRPDACGPH